MLWTLHRVLAVTQIESRALELEVDMDDLDAARKRGEWAMGRIAFDLRLEVIEGEWSEIWREWGLWQVEIELACGEWDGGNSAAKYVSHFFQTGSKEYIAWWQLAARVGLRLQATGMIVEDADEGGGVMTVGDGAVV